MSGLRIEVWYALALGAATAVVSEALTWALLYRNRQYQRLKDELDRTSVKLEALKANSIVESAKNKKAKKEQRLEDNVKSTSRDLGAFRMKSQFILMVLSFLMWNYVSTTFDGIVLAKLPFTPLSFFTKMTHAGVAGHDYTEAGGSFLYILSLMFCRTVLQQVSGQQPSRAATRLMSKSSPFGDPNKFK